MKMLLLIALAFISFSFTPWLTSFEKAQAEAKLQHKYILLNFSGSDWCGPCIKLRKGFFENTSFSQFADSNLVLINADFPRLKKNQIASDIKKANDLLAERYNNQGAFPYTLLLDADGKVLKKWDGLPKESADDFVKEIDAIVHANR